MAVKQCTYCGETKTLSDFHPKGDIFRSQCKVCVNKQNRDYQMTDARKLRRQEIWNKYTRFKKYNLTEEQFNSMITEQDYKCKICDTEIDLGCCVDHCHTTGIVRGLLCRPCNGGLGFFKDNTSSLQKAIRYLNEAPCL